MFEQHTQDDALDQMRDTLTRIAMTELFDSIFQDSRLTPYGIVQTLQHPLGNQPYF